MQTKTITLFIGLLAVLGCTAPGTPASGGSAKTSGTMAIPKETDPQTALAPLSSWGVAQGFLLGMPAWAANLDASVVTQFQATVDGNTVPCTWDSVTTSASGDTQAHFTMTNTTSATNAEVIFRSPSGAVKLATLVDRIDVNSSTNLSADVNARSTAALLECRAIAAKGGKPIKSYTSANFQAVVNDGQTATTETTLRAAFADSRNKGQDTWALPAVVQVTASAATNLSVSLSLGINVGASVVLGN